MEQVTFKGRTYNAKSLSVHPVLAADGMKAQFGIEGKRGACGMMQVFDGFRRVVWLTGHSSRVETEIV